MDTKRKYILLVGFLVIFYIVGIIGLNLEFSTGLFRRLIPFTILMSCFLLFLYHSPRNPRIMIISLAVLVMGYAIEAIGVNTGKIFGNYRYGSVLGPKLFETPLILGFNWLMLIYMIWVVIDNTLKIATWLKIALGSSLMVLYDVILEPVAIGLEMWSWDHHHPPLQNYIAWFVISVVFFYLFTLSKTKIRNRIAFPLLVIQYLFFLLMMVLIIK